MENKQVFVYEDLTEGKSFLVPVRLIRKLRDRKDFENNQDALVITHIEKSNNGHSTIMVRVDGFTNLDSQYGAFYIKASDLLDYLNDTNSCIDTETKREKYLYEVMYLNRGGLRKYIASNKLYLLGDLVLLNSESSSVASAEIKYRWERDTVTYNKYYNLKFDRSIVASFKEIKSIVSIVEDSDTNKLQEKIDKLTDRCNKLESLVLKLTLQNNNIN